MDLAGEKTAIASPKRRYHKLSRESWNYGIRDKLKIAIITIY